MRETRILIVDDSAVVRTLVAQVLADRPGLRVDAARDGRAALEAIARRLPDLVLLDVEMPVLDGLQTLRAIRKDHPKLPVVMFSALTERGAAVTTEALVAGADDYVCKPRSANGLTAARDQIRTELLARIDLLCGTTTASPAPAAAPAAPAAPRSVPTVQPPAPAKTARGAIEIVAIASSTGGPNALAEVLPRLPKDLRVPVVIVQHMPAMFTQLLARSLDQKSALAVAEGRPGAVLEPGQAWIAPGGFHMTVAARGADVVLATNEEPPENSCRPAADVLFRSVAQCHGPNVLAVVLTGMGNDGCLGSGVIRAAGGTIVAQDEASSVVWGMPGAVTRAGLADTVLPLRDIAAEIESRVARRALARLPEVRR